MGLGEDTGITQGQYNLALAIFFISYCKYLPRVWRCANCRSHLRATEQRPVEEIETALLDQLHVSTSIKSDLTDTG